MKATISAGLFVAALATGAAEAQTEMCASMKKMMSWSEAELKGMLGDKSGSGKNYYGAPTDYYTLKAPPGGFEGCRFEAYVMTTGTATAYDLQCTRRAATAQAIADEVDALWTCMKDSYARRAATEFWTGDRFRVVDFSLENPPASGRVAYRAASRSTGRVSFSFGSTSPGNSVVMHMNWQFPG